MSLEPTACQIVRSGGLLSRFHHRIRQHHGGLRVDGARNFYTESMFKELMSQNL